MSGRSLTVERSDTQRAVATLMLMFALVACICASARAQSETTEQHRPHVALVLSGGGARGIAHIGVLRALERLHIPIDSVTGTSMGAVVGGLYAAGYSPDELETIVGTLDWRELVHDTPDRRHLPYRRKVDDHTYLTRWEVGVSGWRVKIPPGLVAGHRLGAALRLLALRAAGIRDFDALPLPFRAVAADITTGEMVVLDRGDLATALRASMAVPGLFSPVDIDGRLLVDGGAVSNLPVDATRTASGDTIVAVDVGKQVAKGKRPDSAAAILSQTVDFLTRREVERALQRVDVLIQPELGDIEFFAFDEAGVLMARGEAAAMQRAESLKKLAVDDAAWSAYLQRQRRQMPKLRLRSVTVDPGLRLPPQAARRAVHTRPGRDLDPVLLEQDLQRMWELGEFERVDFALDHEPEGTWALTINGRRKSWGPNFLRAGVALSSDMEGSSSFNVLGAVTMTQLNRRGGELKVTTQIGGDPAITTELYQPLNGSRVPFAAIGFEGIPSKAQLPIADRSVQYRFWRQRINFDLGIALGQYGEIRTGVRHDLSTGAPTYHATGAPRFHGTDAGVRSSIVIDQLDRLNFPRRGLLSSAELYEAMPSMGADDKYRRLDFQILSAATRGRHTILGSMHGTSALGGVLPADNQLRLGGLLNLSGLPPGEISGSYGAVFAGLYFFRIGRLPYFGEGIYAGTSVETGNAWMHAADVSTANLPWSYSLIFGADTILGPLYIAHGVTSGKKDSFYLYLGRSF